jgi:hypothetical protein
LRLREGNLPGYRDTCARAVERFGRAHDPRTLHFVAWTCVLGPDAVAEPAKPVEWALEAVTRNPRDPKMLNTLAAALYRAGRFRDAIRRLDEAVTARSRDDSVFDWLFLAVAHARLGHIEEARRWLDQAERWFAQPGVKAVRGWESRLACTLLLREAVAVIRDPVFELPADVFAR